MKYFFPIVFIFLSCLNNSIQACSCDRVSISRSYTQSEIVLLVVVGKNHSKWPHFRKWEMEILEVFKGSPLDTLMSGTTCGVNYFEQDTVVIFGSRTRNQNTIYTSMCRGNILVGREKYKDLYKDNPYQPSTKQRRSIIQLNTLHFYKSHLDYIKLSEYWPWFVKRPHSIYGNPFRLGREKMLEINKNGKVVHVKIEVNKRGETQKVAFLNEVDSKHKKAIEDFLMEASWRIKEEYTDQDFVFLESFIYTSSYTQFWEF